MATTTYSERPIFLVDDERAILRAFRISLQIAGIKNIVEISDGRKVLAHLGAREAEVMVLDLSMPHLDGEEILAQVAEKFPDLPVIVATGLNDVQTAVRCMRGGALDYLVKPVEPAKFVASIKQAIENRALLRENTALRDSLLSGELNHPDAFESIVTRNKSLHSLFQYVEMIAPTPRPVLITGESGVGKELVARTIHGLSGLSGEFLAVNVAGLDDTLFADTLFGHEPGAFTGANQKRGGLIKQAKGGTLFLDEIGDLEKSSQVRLLRLLQEGEYYPLGADRPQNTDCRVVAATNHDLAEAQASGRFRNDLYYRLSTHRVHIPPLRERFEDIPLLVDQFLGDAARTLGKKKPTPPPELLTLLQTYSFPGNVRELQGMIFDAVAQHRKGTLSTQSVRKIIAAEEQSVPRQAGLGSEGAQYAIQVAQDAGLIFPTVQEMEKILIDEAMKRAKNNQTIACRMLGITRQTLNKKVNQPPP